MNRWADWVADLEEAARLRLNTIAILRELFAASQQRSTLHIRPTKMRRTTSSTRRLRRGDAVVRLAGSRPRRRQAIISFKGVDMLPRVFVSSTIEDLHHLRDAVRDAVAELEYIPVMSEYGGMWDICRTARSRSRAC